MKLLVITANVSGISSNTFVPQNIPNVQGLQNIPTGMPTANQVVSNPSVNKIAPLLPGGLK